MVVQNRISRGLLKVLITLACSLAMARSASSQSPQPTDTTRIPLRAARDTTRPPKPLAAQQRLSPTMLRVTSVAVGSALLYGMAGAALGSSEDSARCRRNNPGDRRGLFGDWCDFEFEDGTRVGWFTGSFVGATAGAVIGARRRGCPTRSALWRAAGGSIIGMIPGIITAATPSKNTPAPRSMLFASGPILGGIGAALAVRNCHR